MCNISIELRIQNMDTSSHCWIVCLRVTFVACFQSSFIQVQYPLSDRIQREWALIIVSQKKWSERLASQMFPCFRCLFCRQMQQPQGHITCTYFKCAIAVGLSFTIKISTSFQWQLQEIDVRYSLVVIFSQCNIYDKTIILVQRWQYLNQVIV
jgi:hypothetical protein